MNRFLAIRTTAAASAAGARLQQWAADRQAAEARKALDDLNILNGVTFGVKLAVGLGPQTRFTVTWWHRLVDRMRTDGVSLVVLGVDQIEWLLDQLPADAAEGPRN